ncbi:MAG: methyltransferase domain-containing protein [Oscillospiraceae bacterium]|nr:methyltransferase domain-containing protein [Oscillospiraceae bacterium]
MEHYFLCPECKAKTLLPVCRVCGYEIPSANSIYRFCGRASEKSEGEYIGYDNIGEDFEPEVTYWDANNTERYGVYAACGDLIAKKFGSDICVLDLGAGLGTASIPLAKNGIYTIAADISAVMLSTAAKRARGRYDNLILAQMNAYSLMLPDSSVDIVVENAMIHLVDKPELIIKEIVRVLKPGGALIRYSSPGLPVSEEEARQNQLCSEAVSDISDHYYKYLEEHNYKSTVFNTNYREVLDEYFDKPYSEAVEGFVEEFTDKMRFRLHRMKTGAHSDLQETPKELINAAWQDTDRYAREKYGDDYDKIKGFSRYGAALDIYAVKK